MTTFDEARRDVERLRWQLEKAVMVQDRLALIDILNQIPNLPYDGYIATVTWPEDPNGDGTFDVGFESVRNAEGKKILDISDLGSYPAGAYTEPLSSSWDVFRLDRNDVESVLSIAKIRDFQEALTVV